MTTIRGHLVLAVLLFAELAIGAPSDVADEDNKMFALARFRFESGVELPNAGLSFVTRG